MGINNIYITDRNIADFMSVLPKGMSTSHERVLLGCYEDDGAVLGAMSFMLSSYAYEIDWLYVVPEKRRMGVASAMLQQLFHMMTSTGEVYPVRAAYEVKPGDDSLLCFFMSVEGMFSSFSHKRYCVGRKEIEGSRELKKEIMIELDERPFFKLGKKEQQAVLKEIDDDGIYVIDDQVKWEKSCVKELCRVIYAKERIMGAVFVRMHIDGNLELSYIYSKNPVCTQKLIQLTAEDLLKYFPDSRISFDTVVPETIKLAEKIFPECEPVNIYSSEW